MASSTTTLSRGNGLLQLPAIAKLARWRFKQMWRYLLVTWLGLLAMVVLACAGPLFARVATSAYVRSQLATAPDGTYITVDAISTHPTQTQLQQVEQESNHAVQQGVLASYLHAPQVIVQTPPFDMLALFAGKGSEGGQTRQAAFDVVGYDNAQASQHSTVVQGRLPQATTDGTVEIALSQLAATGLGLHVGSAFSARYPVADGSEVWNFRVVGIIAPVASHDTFWAMADPFSKSSVRLNSRYYFVDDGSPSYNVLASSAAIEPKIATLQASFSGNSFTNAFVFLLRYPFDLTRFDANDIPALSQQTTNLDNQFQNLLGRNDPNLAYGNIFGTTFTTLEFSAVSDATGQISVIFLLFVTLALVLFLVSLMSDVLVERQAAIIAILRSRGATRRHIFGAFASQGIVLGVVALLIGPLLAILLVRFIAQALLTPDNQSAVNVLTCNPLAAAFDVKWYALIAVGVALLVLIAAINRATKTDIVAFRREAARPRRVALWRRLYLDLFIAVVLLAGYITYTAFWTLLTQSATRVDPVAYKVLTSVGFLTTPLLVVAVLLLFLRFFPRIVHLATRLVTKRRGAPAVLALAQMERTPRPAARMIVLLALAIAASCFLLTLIASKDQRNVDTATFSVGAADFSGSLPASDASKTFSQLAAYYSHLPGVQSATLGYQDVIQLSADQSAAGQGTLTVDAIDAATYARTAIWPASYSSQPLSALTAQLVSHRAQGITSNVVYALVDVATWQRLHLTQGEQFTLPADSTNTSHIHYIALAQISYTPGVYDTPSLSWSGMGLIVDYQNYVSVKAQATGAMAATLAPNYLWLRTRDDIPSLKHLRNILPSLNDRNQVIATIQNDPNHLGIIGILYIGVAASLVLALLGALVLSWLTASNRLTNFAVARALGMDPRQIAAVLLWEQCFTYALGFVLGIGLGALLLAFVPSVVGSLPAGNGLGLDIGFNVPAIQIVVPYGQLLIMLGVLALVCLGALLLMARIVSRPSLSQTLRLNED